MNAPPVAPLLEREIPQEVLTEASEDVKSGHGRCVFIVAPAGLGKTVLLDRFLDQWRGDGTLVGHAVASPMEMTVPFGLLDRAISMLGGIDAIGQVASADVVEPASSRFYRTLAWLEKTCAAEPLLLALDDLHWSDDDSLELRGYLCRRMSQSPVLFVGTLRPEPAHARQLVEDLVATAHATVISISPLSRTSSTLLATQFLRREPTEVESEMIWRSTAGTPLLIKTAAQALNFGSPVDALSIASTDGLRFLLERFTGLGSEVLSYARAASIFGVRFRHSLAIQLARLDGPMPASAHDRLVQAGLLSDLGGDWSRFVHPLFAQGLLESVATSTRAELHARAFRLLVEDGLSDAEAAEHAYAANLVGDPMAIEVSARAGQHAALLGAFQTSAKHLSQAIELAGERAPLALRLAYAGVLIALTRTGEASAICREILADPTVNALDRSEVLRLLAQAGFVDNRPETAQRLFEDAAVEGRADPVIEGRVLMQAVSTCLVTSSIHWSNSTSRRALELLPVTGAEHATCSLLHAYVRLMSGDPSEVGAIESAFEAWRRGSLVVDSASRWAIAFHLQSAMKILERYEESEQVFGVEFSRAKSNGSPLMMATMAISRADNLHRLGRVRDALELVQETTALTMYPMTPWSELARAALLVELDQSTEATEFLALLRDYVSSVPRGYGAIIAIWVDVLEARLQLDAGRPDNASTTMLDAQSLAESTGLVHPLAAPWWPTAFEAHIRAGRISRAEALADSVEELSSCLGLRWPRAAIALGRAQIGAARSSSKDADGLFDAAIAAHREAGLPIFLAEALLAYGSHLRRTRRAFEARAPLREAVSLAESSDSPRVARIALGELLASGGRHPRPTAVSTSLTPRETQIAELAALGHSNVEIAAAMYLSVKTVEHHLGRVFQKLGISSRRALFGRKF